MDENLERLKQQWQKLAVDDAQLRETNKRLSEQLQRERVKSLQDRLARRVGRDRWLGLLLPLMAPGLNKLINLPVALCVAYAAFGLIMFVLNNMLYIYIKEERLTTMPVVDAIERATRIRYNQQRLRIAGMLMGIPLVLALMFYTLEGQGIYTLYGAIVGLVIGLGVGIPKMLTNHSLARNIIKSLRDPQPTDEPEN
ncbi:MAG: hypothetical protein K2M00_09580 [Muribaculaceae bacterium]|nr:hypothetical protein [Muribaculaceae bacterium]